MRPLLTLATLAALAPPAFAGPVMDFSGLAGTHTPINEPIAIPSVGLSTDGFSYGVSVGWGLGDRQVDGLFPSIDTRRILFHVRRLETDPMAEGATANRTQLGLTFGWFTNIPSLFDAGLDLGLAGTSASQFGPMVHVTGGKAGFGIRLSAGLELGDDARLTGAAEVVLDIVVLGRTLARL